MAGRSDKGALIAYPVTAFARSGRAQPVSVLYTPGPHAMIDGVSAGRDAVYASIYEDVTGSIHEFRPVRASWSDTRLALPRGGSTSIVSTNDWGPQATFTFQSFLTPPSLYAYGGSGSPALIKAQPSTFDARGNIRPPVLGNLAGRHEGAVLPHPAEACERAGADHSLWLRRLSAVAHAVVLE